MDIKPVKKYREPKYPIKQVVINNPEILKTLPERWKNSVYVGTALSTLLLFTLTSCVKREVSGGKSAAVAPIFEHGSGRGSFGCVSVAPPSFLSEEEAYQVIQEEGRKYGITFEKNGLEIENVKIPETKHYANFEANEGEDSKESPLVNSSRNGDLMLDGYDGLKKIGYEFISTNDYDAWQVKQNMFSTVESYDFLSAARILRNGLERKTGENTVGVFYNPMTQMSPEEMQEIREQTDWALAEAKVKALAKGDLREQVKDFLEWLKSQGIV
jgi:hypothetical protein